MQASGVSVKSQDLLNIKLVHTFKQADDLFHQYNRSAVFHSSLSPHTKRGLGITEHREKHACITNMLYAISYNENKYNKIILDIFLN